MGPALSCGDMSIEICNKRLEELVKLAEFQNRFLLSLCVLNFVFCIVAILGNLLVIRAVWKATMMSSTLKAMFMSLAFSDLVVGLFVQPMNGAIIAVILDKVASGNYDIAFLCPTFVTMYLSFGYFFAGTSFWSMVAIAVDRLLAVSLHLRYNEFVTTKRVVVCLALLWLTSGLVTSVYIVLPNYNDIVAVVLEVLGILVTSVAYYRVFKVARYHQNKIHSHCQVNNDLKRLKVVRVKRSAYNAFVVYTVFLICYIPNIFCGILLVVSDFRLSLITAFYITIFLIYLNSSVNLFVYCWRYREIREIMKKTMAKIFRVKVESEVVNLRTMNMITYQERRTSFHEHELVVKGPYHANQCCNFI